MSIRLMTRIWDSGAYAGGTLLVLLALADWANDQGERIFPRIETLAAKARLSVKQCRRVLEALLTDQVIEDLTGKGIRAGELLSLKLNLERLTAEGQNVPEGQDVQAARHLGKSGGTSCPGSGTKCPAYIDEPSSYPSKEPSREPSAGSPSSEALLFQDLPSKQKSKARAGDNLEEAYAAYDAAAQRNGWGRVGKRTGTRDGALKARLKDAGGMDGWIAALKKAEESDFCMGRAPPRDGKSPFKLDFDFLVSETKFVRLMEGKYDNRESSGPGRGGGGSNAEIAARVAARRAAARVGRHPES